MALSAIVLGLASIAAASPPSPAPYALTYRAPEGCPAEAQLRADVAAHVRGGTRPSGVQIRIEIAAAGGQFSGELFATDRFGSENRQSLAGADCGEIAHALAFLAGLAVELGERRPTEIVATSPPPAAPPAPTPELSSPERSFALTGWVMAGVTGGLADVPSPSGEIGVAIESTRPRLWAPGIAAAVLVAGDSQIDGQRGSAQLSLLGGRLAACPLRFARSKVDLRPCAGVTFGQVWGRATSLMNAPSVTEPWLSAEATLAVRWLATSRILLQVEGGAVFPIQRASFAFAFQPDGQAFFTVPSVTGRVSAGCGFRF
jgi:hypothetical protein